MFSIVIVTFDSADVVADAIRSVPAGHEVIVVDNASTDRSADIAAELGARVVRNRENLGFGAACNRGAAKAQGEVLLFLNPDARLEPGAVEAFEAALAKYPQGVAFNPSFVSPSGEGYARARNRLIDDRIWFSEPILGDIEIPMASGAALAFRKSVFDQLGGFDENIFLYFEDDDLSARAIKAGHEIYHVEAARCTHLVGRSSSPSAATAAIKDYHLQRSKLYVAQKHGLHPRARWTAWRYRVKLAFALLFRQQAKAARLGARLNAIADAQATFLKSASRI